MLRPEPSWSDEAKYVTGHEVQKSSEFVSFHLKSCLVATCLVILHFYSVVAVGVFYLILLFYLKFIDLN